MIRIRYLKTAYTLTSQSSTMDNSISPMIGRECSGFIFVLKFYAMVFQSYGENLRSLYQSIIVQETIQL